ncbi:MAG: hypothetical protein AAF823_07465 [Planctomycetota bacterium]
MDDAAGPLLLIVTGSGVDAELRDRPLAYELAERVVDWCAAHGEVMSTAVRPVVVSDLGYLNDKSLQRLPTIGIGGPEQNAFTEYYAGFLPDPNPIEDTERQVVIQMDPEFTDLHVSVWGSTADLTQRGVELFCEDYLDRYLRAVATQVEPMVD